MKTIKFHWQGALIAALLALCGCSSIPNTSTLLLGGDVFLAREGEPLYSGDINPWGDFLAIRRTMDDSFFAVNLESPLGNLREDLDAESLAMNLCAPSGSVKVLTDAAVNLVTTANNHLQDCANSGENSAAILDAAGIAQAGGQGEILYKKISGRKAAFITLNDYSAPYELDSILSQVKLADQNSQLVVVSVHWGQEYQVNPTTHQKELAGQLVNAGADIVWGHHPHVLQPVEWIRSTEDGHKALVMYSFGNLISDQWMLPDALRSVVVSIEFDQEGIRKIMLIPVEMDFSSRSLRIVNNAEDIQWWSDRLNLDDSEKGYPEIGFWNSKGD